MVVIAQIARSLALAWRSNRPGAIDSRADPRTAGFCLWGLSGLFDSILSSEDLRAYLSIRDLKNTTILGR
jgi:hypothetical protein